MKSVENQIFNRITKHKRGKLFFPVDFAGLGSDESIRKALSKLTKDKVLERLAQGIYLYPKAHPVYGNLYPSTEEIAIEIARRDHARIILTGSAALHKLRLSTQVPMNMVYLTDGAPRKIKVGKQKINFKAAISRKFATKGKTSTLVIQALQELGQNGIDEILKEKLKAILATEEPRLIKHDIQFAPAWIAKLITNLT